MAASKRKKKDDTNWRCKTQNKYKNVNVWEAFLIKNGNCDSVIRKHESVLRNKEKRAGRL